MTCYIKYVKFALTFMELVRNESIRTSDDRLTLKVLNECCFLFIPIQVPAGDTCFGNHCIAVVENISPKNQTGSTLKNPLQRAIK